MKRKITTLPLIMVSFITSSEPLKTNSFVDIDVFTSDIRAITAGPELLTCSSGDPIEYLRGGVGTEVINGQTFVTAINPTNPEVSGSFSVEYKVNDVTSCSGITSPTTPAWNGNLTVGGGTGEFERNIYTGIPLGSTEFTLNCQQQKVNYNLKGAVSKNDIELTQMYQQMIMFAHNYNQVFVWDIISGKIYTKTILEDIRIPQKFKLMIRQIGQEVYFVPAAGSYTLNDTNEETNPKYSTMLVLSENPTPITLTDINKEYELPMQLGERCLNYSPINKGQLNATIGQKIQACDLTNKNKVYLTAIIYEK